MTLENLLGIFAIPFFAHAAIIFMQSFWRGPSQYDDLMYMQIKGLSKSMKVQKIFNIKLCSKFYCKDLFASILVWSYWLRRIGFIPVLLYLSVFFLLLFEFAIKEIINVDFLLRILLGVAFLLQLIYLFLKFYSKIPGLLMHLHKDYKDSSFLHILLDIVPLLKR